MNLSTKSTDGMGLMGGACLIYIREPMVWMGLSVAETSSNLIYFNYKVMERHLGGQLKYELIVFVCSASSCTLLKMGSRK